ncbi:MAG: helix-turn-helix domain-containing protein [Bradyrhizobium sp.]
MSTVLSRFGQRCRDLRIAKKLTMGDQAKFTGYSVSEISSIECGSRTPPDDYLEKFQKLVALDNDEFRDLKRRIRSNVIELSRIKTLGENGRSMRLFRKISQMNPDQIRAFNRSPDNGE